MSVTASDGFSGSNGSDVNGRTMDAAGGGSADTWVVDSGAAAIQSNKCQTTGSTIVHDSSMAAGGDMDVSMVVSAVSQYVLLRFIDASNALWVGRESGAGHGRVYKVIAGSFTQIGTDSPADIADGSVMLGRVVGNAVSIYDDGVLVAGPFTDSDLDSGGALTSGKAGFRCNSDGSPIDNWAVTVTPVLTAPTNHRGVRSAATQVDLTWTDPGSPATDIDVQYATDAAFTSPTTVNVGLGVGAKSITGLTAGTRYWFRVRSTDGSTYAYSSSVAPPVWFTGVSRGVYEDWNADDDTTTSDGASPTTFRGACGRSISFASTTFKAALSTLGGHNGWRVGHVAGTITAADNFTAGFNSNVTILVMARQSGSASSNNNYVKVGTSDLILRKASTTAGLFVTGGGLTDVVCAIAPQSAYPPLGQLDVFCLSSDGSTMRHGINGAVLDTSCSTLAISGKAYSLTDADADVVRIVIFDHVLTKAEIQAAVMGMLPSAMKQLLYEGDSLTAVTGSNDSSNLQHVQYVAQHTFTNGVLAGLVDAAQGGAVIDEATRATLSFDGGSLEARETTWIDPYYQAARGQLLIVHIGTNDMNLAVLGGSDPTVSITALATRVTAYKAASPNMKVAILTIPPRGNEYYIANGEAWRQEYNKAILNYSSPPWDYVLSYQDDASIGLPGKQWDTTYFETAINPVHFLPGAGGGYEVLATSYTIPFVERWLGGTATPPTFSTAPAAVSTVGAPGTLDLSALVSDGGGEGTCTYGWTLVGGPMTDNGTSGAHPTLSGSLKFSRSGTNAAKAVTVAAKTATGTYYILCRVTNAAGAMAHRIAKATFNALATFPTVPTGGAGVALSGTSVRLTWNPSVRDTQAITSYKLYKTDNGGSSYTLVNDALVLTYDHTGLDSPTQYQYAVSAVDAAATESAKSALFQAGAASENSSSAHSPTPSRLGSGGIEVGCRSIQPSFQERMGLNGLGGD